MTDWLCRLGVHCRHVTGHGKKEDHDGLIAEFSGTWIKCCKCKKEWFQYRREVCSDGIRRGTRKY